MIECWLGDFLPSQKVVRVVEVCHPIESHLDSVVGFVPLPRAWYSLVRPRTGDSPRAGYRTGHSEPSAMASRWRRLSKNCIEAPKLVRVFIEPAADCSLSTDPLAYDTLSVFFL